MNNNNGEYNENYMNDNNGGNKGDNRRKNILATIGIMSVVIILIIIIMVSGGTDEASINENNDKNNVAQNENMSMEELVDKIESQPGYEDEETTTVSPTIDTDLEDSETEYDEESSEDEISEEATIDPEKLPNPDFNNDDDDEREPQNQSQGTNATFQPKKYMIDTNSKRELKVRLKGTPKAKVKGIYRYVDEKGELKTKEWDERLNKEGEDTVTIRISHKPDKVEFQILSIEHKDGSNIGDCIVDSYEVK
jgi:type IV secretory pathway VirB10-like protein